MGYDNQKSVNPPSTTEVSPPGAPNASLGSGALRAALVGTSLVFLAALAGAVFTRAELLVAVSAYLLPLPVTTWALSAFHWHSGERAREREDRASGQTESWRREWALEHLRESLTIQRAAFGAAHGLAAAITLGLLLGWLSLESNLPGPVQGVLGIAGLALGFLLLMAARGFPGKGEPGAEDLARALAEAHWVSLLVGGVGFVVAGWEEAAPWATRLVAGLTLVHAVEGLFRVGADLVLPEPPEEDLAPPGPSLLRELLLSPGGPFRGVLETLEQRFGISLRTSWALRFLQAASLPVAVLLVAFSWLLSSATVVPLDSLGLEERLGRVEAGVRGPGLHWTLPRPFGRILHVPVHRIRELPLGYVPDEAGEEGAEPAALLWTKPHGEQEFGLVLGDGAELVVVNALLYYKVRGDEEGLSEYLYGIRNPELGLEVLAYRVLSEVTRSSTLEEVLTFDRERFRDEVLGRLQEEVASRRLGLEVVDLAVVSLHPPVEASPDYLDVINARLDARRAVTTAEGRSRVRLLEARSSRGLMVAEARAAVAGSRSEALVGAQRFTALEEAHRAAPEEVRFRLGLEALERGLGGARFYLVDPTLLGAGSQLWLGGDVGGGAGVR